VQCGATAGCHKPPGPAANLDLVSPGLAARVVGVSAVGSPGVLVDPADPQASVLYRRVTSTTSPMPPTGALGADTTACILSWIKGLASGGPSPAPDGSSGADAAASVVRIACGATAAYTDHAGDVWAADTDFDGGMTNTNSPLITISNTMDGALYNAQRYGAGAGGAVVSFAYAIPVPNGSYTVTLKFAETYRNATGQRVFDVSINGEKKLTAFDIIKAAGGANIANDQSFDVDVTGGALNVQFDPAGGDGPKINAIQIAPK
jgi:hypothetical protein